MSPEAQLERFQRDAEAARLATEQEKQKKEQLHRDWDANRWFRPWIDEALQVPTTWIWSQISDPMLQVIFSMFGEGWACGGIKEVHSLEEDFAQMTFPAIKEVHQRGIEWPVGAYALELDPELKQMETLKLNGPIFLNKCPVTDDIKRKGPYGPATLAIELTSLSDRHLTFWYGCASHVIDYSCLSRGVRQIIMHLYHATAGELNRRGLPLTFLFDLEA